MNYRATVIRFLLSVIIVGALVSCRQEPEPVSTSIIEQVSTATVELTPPPETVEVQAAKPEPTSTPTPEKTAEPLPSPTVEEATVVPEESGTTGGFSAGDYGEANADAESQSEPPDIIQMQDEFFALVGEAESTYQAENYAQALELNNQMLEKALASELEPLIVLAYIFRGDTYAALKDYEAAIADYVSILNFEGGKPEILNNLCWWYGLTEQPQFGLPYCEQAASDRNPSHLDSRGLNLALAGDLAGAAADFQASIDGLADTQDPELYDLRAERRIWLAMLQQGQNPFSAQVMADLRESNPLAGPSTPEVPPVFPLLQALDFYWEGRKSFDDGDYELAQDAFTQALEIFPQFQEAYAYRGDTFLFDGDPEQAIEDYSEAVALNPADPQVYYLRAKAFQGINDHRKAINDFSEAIAINNSNSALFNDRAISRVFTGDHEGALEDYEQALTLNPVDPVVLWNRADLHRQLGDLDAAKDDLEKALEIGLSTADEALAREDLADVSSQLEDAEVAVPDSTGSSAAWEALQTPAPTASPVPASTTAVLRLEADGTGDYASLSEAIKEAPRKATIALGPGTFSLEESLDISKAIHLVGAGMDQTEIVSSAAGYAVQFDGFGPFISEDITYRHEGEETADVVVILGGEVVFIRNRFTGAVSGSDGGGVGLGLIETTGLVRENVADNNGFAGVFVGTEDIYNQTIVERNFLNGNAGAGIVFSSSTRGTAQQNECSRNGQGIVLMGQSQLTLEENVCRENEGNGIAYYDDSAGVARRNDVSNNSFGGIEVNDQAQPLLEENFIRSNGGNGILYLGSSAGTARKNDCSMNSQNGIDLGDTAQPTLEENSCTGNGSDGIGYYINSGGTARANILSGNERNGISVRNDSQPTLLNNVCRGNATAGISFLENAGGLASKNECSENQYGFFIDEESTPTVEKNVCNNNAVAGLYYWLNAGGIARLNECSGNRICIYVPETANPELIDNVCIGNIEDEIVDERE